MAAQSHLASLESLAVYPSSSRHNFVSQSRSFSLRHAWPIAGSFSSSVRNGKTASFTRQHILAERINSSSGGAKQVADDDVMNDIRTLVDHSQELRDVVNFSNRGIGADMRDRVNRLYDRVSLLKVTAERDVRSSGRVSAQRIATLKGLQREQSSLENIVQLAMEAGPVLTGSDLFNSQKSNTAMIQGESNSLFGVEELRPLDDESTNKDESMNIELYQGRKGESASKVADVPKYVMTAPASEGSSPLAAFRAEIERRVMEQLVGNQKVESVDEGIVGQTISERNTGHDNLLQQKDSKLRMQNSRKSGQVAYTDGALKIPELERLKSQLGGFQEAFKDLELQSTRANLAEAKVRNLEIENAASIPIDLHEQAISRVTGALIEARARVTQIAGEVRDNEAMLVAMKEDVMAKQQKLFERVEELTNEIGRRVTVEEMNNAVRKTFDEIEEELKNAQDRIGFLDLELEKKETMILLLQEEWKVDKMVLQSDIVDINDRLYVVQKVQEDMSAHYSLAELTSIKERLRDFQEERKLEQSQLYEAQEKVRLLEDKIAGLTQRADDAEAQMEIQRQALLDSAKVLVTDMLKDQEKLRNESNDAHQSPVISATEEDNEVLKIKINNLRKSDLELEPSFSRVLQESANREGFQLSDERAAYFGSFFAVIGQLIRQEIERMIAAPATNLHQPSPQIFGGVASNTNPEMTWDQLLGRTSIHKDGQNGVLQFEKTITLLYESSWERAFVHCSADNTGWTKPPGLLMPKANDLNGRPCKVFKVNSSTLEFVLTDGDGHWDRDPSGNNYIIREPGSFVLSAGVLKLSIAD